METVTLAGKSKKKMALIIELAKNLGLTVHKNLSEDEEDMALLNAMKTEKTGEYVDTKAFLKKLEQ